MNKKEQKGSQIFSLPREIRDTYEVIEWAAVQPWSNGNVGMIGLGYYGAHQPLVAQLQPPTSRRWARLARSGTATVTFGDRS